MGAIFGFTGPLDPALLHRMGEAMSHRGSHGVTLDEHPSGSVGYRAGYEESIRDKLGTGLLRDGDVTIAVAGYPTACPGVRRLLADYRQRGLDLVRDIRGAFVLVIRDRDTVHLARDGAGGRTVYYAQHGGRFLFAIEPKGILAVPGFPRRLRPAAVAAYLTFSFVPGEQTMLQHLYELPAGHIVSCRGDGPVRQQRFFTFEHTPPDSQHSPRHWVSQTRQAVSQAVRARLPANDDPIGVFLSGGLDSSLITAEVVRQCRENGRHPVKTYAIHFGASYPNELPFARAVADHCGTDHEEVLVGPKDIVAWMRRMAWHLDDPIGDPITSPNFELSRRAAQDVRWVFNGEGGDPCFGGPKNIPMMLHHWYGGVAREDGYLERQYLQSYRRGYEELSHLLSPDFLKHVDFHQDLERIVKPFFDCPRTDGLLNKLMAINIRLKGAHLILPKVERMTAAWGVTPLSPLFDERLIQLSFLMPPRLKLAAGVEKIVLKQAYQDLLPRQIVDRPKSGMRVPVHYWFKGELRRYARKILSPRQVRRVGIFNDRRVKQLLDYDTQEGPGRYGLRLWMLITFEMWRRIVVEKEPV